MKKIITLMLTAAMLLSMACFAVPAQAAGIFEDPSNINIVYIGGSITQGTSASPNWVEITGDYFSKTFGEKNVTNHNAGVGGTGSEYGLLRLQRDVIDKNPDMVFIEFTVNDKGKDTTRYLESIILSLQRLEKVPYICFVHTTNAGMAVDQTNHRKVADFYGLAQIDFQAKLKEEVQKSGKPITTYIGDGTHPTAEGYAVYADEAIKCLKTGNYYTKPLKKETRLNPKSLFVNTVFTPAVDHTTTWGWTGAGSYITTTDNAGAAGAKISYEFTGNVLAIEHRISNKSGMYQVSVDGKVMETVNTYHKNANQMALGYYNFDLGQGKHTLEIEVINRKDSASGGYMVGIYNIITNKAMDFDTKTVDQNFDDGDNTAITDTNTSPVIAWEWGGGYGVNGTGGLKVTTGTGTYGSSNGVAFNVDSLEKGRTYALSAKIKLGSIEKLVTDNVIFVFRLDGVDESGAPNGKQAFVKAVVENAGLNNQEFTTVTAKVTFTGEGVLNSNKPILCNNRGTFEVRVGGDKLAEVTGSKDVALTYYIDDIKMIPTEGTETTEPAPAAPFEIQILVDGVKVEADVPPVIVNDRTLVPVRAIFEALGAEVEWVAQTRTAQAVRGDIHVAIQIDNPVMKINDTELTLDVPAQIVDDRTLVPVRAVSESFDADVDWNGETRTVIITTK